MAFSSGQGTVASLTAILETGDHVLCAEGVYSGTPEILRNLKVKGIDFDSVDFTDLNNVKQGIKSNTKVCGALKNKFNITKKAHLLPDGLDGINHKSTASCVRH